ncbi:protein-export chaperone SecB [Secundilactobacillus mixtipabuli]|uniref:Preprotein translocase subunit SecB n=1 Tax=Secundilactobacillus mixtipabuli TaxID=1435342 RepID=A0A1Z5IBR8_9LACO|nr:protein-export chaperone SecB [Secundilactobacillus mixtipabuli]GAW99097.1 preprotein translocase subunit SecB [Secundilactobacillus mixtipabuli]
MTMLQFNGYRVTKMQYQRNDSYQRGEAPIKFDPQIKATDKIDQNHIDVTLTLSVGSLNNKAIPFQVQCAVAGQFTYHPDEDSSGIGVDSLIRNNAVAILYPYVRAIVATLTTTSNEFPGYVMPTINVAEVLAHQDN